MGTSEKRGLPNQPKAALRKDGVPVNVTPLRDDTLAASQAFIRQKVNEKRSYLKAAFANPYNLSLLAGGLAASALTFSPLLAIVTVGLEILWVVNAPGSKKLQEWLWDPAFDQQQQAAHHDGEKTGPGAAQVSNGVAKRREAEGQRNCHEEKSPDKISVSHTFPI